MSTRLASLSIIIWRGMKFTPTPLFTTKNAARMPKYALCDRLGLVAWSAYALQVVVVVERATSCCRHNVIYFARLGNAPIFKTRLTKPTITLQHLNANLAPTVVISTLAGIRSSGICFLARLLGVFLTLAWSINQGRAARI